MIQPLQDCLGSSFGNHSKSARMGAFLTEMGPQFWKGHSIRPKGWDMTHLRF